MTDANTDGARMVAACTSGDEATVRELLRETPSLARQVPVGPLAPLHYAVREGHASIVRLLLEHGADARRGRGASLPHSTENRGHRRRPRVQRSRGAHRQGDRGTTEPGALGRPLTAALRESDLATIQRELQRDPSAVNTTDEDGNTPLHRAAQAEDTADSAEFMKFLLDHGAALDVPNHLGFTPVYVTLFRNHGYTYARPRWGLFELLLARGAPYDINLACVKGDIDTVRCAFGGGRRGGPFSGAVQEAAAVVRGRVRPARHRRAAAGRGRRSQRPGSRRLSHLSPRGRGQAQRSGDGADAARARRRSQRHDRRRRGGPVGGHRARQPRHGEPDCLLRRSAADSLPGLGGDIVTLAAVLHENPKLALSAIYIPNPQRPKEAAQALRLALHHGVNPKDICLWTLFRASGNPELLRVFLEAGADPNVIDEDGGCTLLHFLTAFPDTKPPIEVLLEFKANINARDSFFGFTPLTWAVVHRRLDMVQFLLAHGAAVELPDDQPWTTPRFWAKHLEEPAIMQALAE